MIFIRIPHPSLLRIIKPVKSRNPILTYNDFPVRPIRPSLIFERRRHSHESKSVTIGNESASKVVYSPCSCIRPLAVDLSFHSTRSSCSMVAEHRIQVRRSRLLQWEDICLPPSSHLSYWLGAAKCTCVMEAVS